jgi:hypothetical protein
VARFHTITLKTKRADRFKHFVAMPFGVFDVLNAAACRAS